MEKIIKYLLIVAGVVAFVICAGLLVSGINGYQKTENIDKNINYINIDNKTNVGLVNAKQSLIDLNKKRSIKLNKEGFKIKVGAKVNVTKIPVPKEKIIEAISKGDKKVTKKDIIAIAEELNISMDKLTRIHKNESIQVSY